jgi:peptidoglycan/LPS O-acetylase OafA/YrhL
VLVVMLLHFRLPIPIGGMESILALGFKAGWIGVDLFFVLSGFLITGILYDSRDQPGFFRNFYGRRVLRILPLYYGYLFLLFVVLPTLVASYAAEHAASDRRIWLWTHLGNVLMARDGWEGMPSHTTHLWSLAIEEQFYLVWPLVVFLVPKRRLASVCSGLFGLALLTRLYLVARGNGAAAYLLTPARLDTLAAGAYVAIVLRQQGADEVRRRARLFLPAGLVLIALGSLWTIAHGSREFLPPLGVGTQTFAYSGLSLAFAAVIAFAVTDADTSRLARTLSGRTLRFFGKYSYALYIIHVPIRNVLLPRVAGLGLRVAGSQLPAQLTLTATGIGVSVGLALLSWNLLESPFLGLKRHCEPGTHDDPPRAIAQEVALTPPS